MKLTAEKKRIFYFLILLILAGRLGVDLYLPSMPDIASALAVTDSTIKLTIPLYLFGFGISQILYGPASDRFGRKPVLNFGMVLFLIGSVGCALAPNGLVLILSRVVQGLGTGATIVIVRSILRDVFHGKQMAIVSARIALVWTAVPILAPVIGGYIQEFVGWRANFGVMFFTTLVVWLLVLFKLKETLLPSERHKHGVVTALLVYKKVFIDKVFIAFALTSALSLSYFASFVTASPFLLQNRLGLTPVEFGWTFIILVVGVGIGAFLSSRLVHHIKIIHVITIGSLILFLATVAMVILALMNIFTVLAVIVPPAVASIGGGMVVPNCTVGAMTSYKRDAGIAGASLGFIQLMSGFLFTLLVSQMQEKTALPLSLELGAISLLALFFVFLFIRPYFVQEEEEEEGE